MKAGMFDIMDGIQRLSRFSGLEVHSCVDARCLVVSFASYVNEGRAAPAYAFMNVVLSARGQFHQPVDVVYLLAHCNDWYLSGVRCLGTSMHESMLRLRWIVEGYEASLFLGNSMGGYAALAFGLQVPATRVLSFSPQTRLDAPFCRAIGERRWSKARSALQERYQVEAYSLRNIAGRSSLETVRCKVHVGALQPQDVAYAMELEQQPGVELNVMDGHNHDLVHRLRDSGMLEQMVIDEVRALTGMPSLSGAT